MYSGGIDVFLLLLFFLLSIYFFYYREGGGLSHRTQKSKGKIIFPPLHYQQKVSHLSTNLLMVCLHTIFLYLKGVLYTCLLSISYSLKFKS